MEKLRPLILLLMLVVMLPWGAWLEGRGAAGAATAPVAPVVALASVKAGVVLAPKPKDCRMAKLPGGSCAPDAVLPQAVQLMPQVRVQVLRPQDTLVVASGHILTIPRRPPRLV